VPELFQAESIIGESESHGVGGRGRNVLECASQQLELQIRPQNWLDEDSRSGMSASSVMDG